jgi:hypothetical protein
VYEFTNGSFGKKKLKHAVKIPKTISARDLLQTAEVDDVYELVAVLYHKGLSVDSGHYIANVCDYNTKDWWKNIHFRVSFRVNFLLAFVALVLVVAVQCFFAKIGIDTIFNVCVSFVLYVGAILYACVWWHGNIQVQRRSGR